MSTTSEQPIRILFAGRKAAARDALRWAVEQGVEVVAVLTDSESAHSPCADYARIQGLPVLSQAEAEQALHAGQLDYELGISFLYWQRLKGLVLQKPRLGFINFHPAPLPDLKGVGGYNVALLERRRQYGVSAHYVDEQIDTGPIIEVVPVPIDPETDTAEALEARCMSVLGIQFRRLLGEACRGEVLPSSANRGGRYISRDQMNDMKEIAPEDDAQLKARAFWFPPYEGAWLAHGDRRMTVVPSCVLDALGSHRDASAQDR